MRKPLGGLVSSLAFVLACEDSTGPQQAATAKIDPHGSGTNGSCPQIVQFDRETGRITILDQELSSQLRAYYGVQPGASGVGEAVVVFVGAPAKAVDTGDTIHGGDTILNLRC